MPVPPPTIAIGVWPKRCRRASAITGSSDPTCRLDAVGSKPMYAVTRSRREQLAQPFGGVVHHPAPVELVEESRHRDRTSRFTISVDGDQPPRAALQDAARVPASASRRRHRRVRLSSYERHALDVTRDDRSRRGSAAARSSGLRIGLITDVHRSRWVSHDDVAAAVDALMAERPDLIVLGGDYVTWGDRRLRRAVAPKRSRRSPRRTASSPFSAITTTITTCRRRWRSTASRC